MPEPVEAPTPEETPTSLADHEAQFSPQAPHQPPLERRSADDADPPPVERRHRAKSQRATADDVDEIAKWTKELRETEGGIEIPRLEGESDRVYGLRKRTEIAKLAKRPKETPPPATQRANEPPPPRTAPPIPSQPSVEAFTEKEPAFEDFADASDPGVAYLRALTAYDRRKDAFELQLKQTQTQTEAQQRQTHEQRKQWLAERDREHGQRLGKYLTEHPDAKAAFEAESARPAQEQLALTPVMFAAMHLHEQGPAFMHKLIQDRELADELFLLTDGKALSDNPAIDPLVATVQRRLLTRLKAVNTGSATPRALHVAPRPPNPVRTVPQTPTTDAPPPEGSSLRDHEAYYGPRRR